MRRNYQARGLGNIVDYQHNNYKASNVLVLLSYARGLAVLENCGTPACRMSLAVALAYCGRESETSRMGIKAAVRLEAGLLFCKCLREGRRWQHAIALQPSSSSRVEGAITVPRPGAMR